MVTLYSALANTSPSRSESSMDDGNSVPVGTPSTKAAVQSPLWTMVTIALLLQSEGIGTRSESSMDDGNAGKG